MKSNAPERIYCESDGLGNIVKVHNIKWPDDEAENIEYIRTDAFIEKAAVWLDETLKNTDFYEDEIELMIKEFKNAMKGEEV